VRKSNQLEIRALLRLYTDGMSVAELASLMDMPSSGVLRALKNMPDAYIDRWIYVRGQDAGVWCVVVPPEDCPKPTRKPK
jgi:hypothetical protein